MSIKITDRFVAGEVPFGDALNLVFLDVADAFDKSIGEGLVTTDFIDGSVDGSCIGLEALEIDNLPDDSFRDSHFNVGAFTAEKLQQVAGTCNNTHLLASGAVGTVEKIGFPNFASVATKDVVMIGGVITDTLPLYPSGIWYTMVRTFDSAANLFGTNPSFDSVNHITILFGAIIVSPNINYEMTKPIITSKSSTGFTAKVYIRTIDGSGYSQRTFRFCWLAIGWRTL